MSNRQSVTDFEIRLSSERAALSALVALLESEQKVLIDGDIEQLPVISDSKIAAVQELGKFANARKNDMLSHQDVIKTRGLDAWIQGYSAQCLLLWNEILKLVEKMDNLNRTNGILIQTKQRINQQALAVLLQTSNKTQSLYGADGQTHLPSSSRILGSV
jgi:flagellar biosynthesis/type III secretory pathway chaperone